MYPLSSVILLAYVERTGQGEFEVSTQNLIIPTAKTSFGKPRCTNLMIGIGIQKWIEIVESMYNKNKQFYYFILKLSLSGA